MSDKASPDRCNEAEQALRILDTLEASRVSFRVSRGQARWLVSVKLNERATHVLSGETLADALAQLAQAVTT